MKRVDRGLLNWGVFLIALGVVPLAVQQDWLAKSIAVDLSQLWPLILVGIGLGLILRWTPFAWLGGALVAGTLGIMLGSLLAGGVPAIVSACVGSGDDGEAISRNGAASSSSFSLDVELSCGEVSVMREAGATWSVVATHGGTESTTIEGNASDLRVRQDFSGGGFFDFAEELENDWRIGLPARAALTLGMTLNAAEGVVDLGPGPFDTIQGTFNAADIEFHLAEATPDAARLDMTFNASSGTISLPDASIRGDVTLNASSLELCVPSAADVRVEHDGTLSSDDLGQSGLLQRDSGWQTEGYDTASERIDLDISSTVSSFSLQRREACP